MLLLWHRLGITWVSSRSIESHDLMRRHSDARKRARSHRLLDDGSVDISRLYPERIDHETHCILLLAEDTRVHSLIFVAATREGSL